ncbi:carboxyl transferase domain-containing protein, partial [Fructilactobacillus fructivorans]
MTNKQFEKISPAKLNERMDQIPDHIWVQCPICKKSFYKKDLGKFKECPNCHYAFRIGAKERIQLMLDEFEPINTDLKASKKFNDAQYVAKLKKAREVTGINESVLSGIGTLDGMQVAVAAMDWRFVMASLGTATGEILARLFETATEKKLPVIVFTASGGARMQEGIHSLMQMAKVSEAVA